DIDAAIEICLARHAPACVSVSEPPKSPYWMYTLTPAGHMHPLLAMEGVPTRRQALPAVYALNGAVYVARVAWFEQSRSFLTEETVAYQMPAARSVDIDTELDFRVAELALQLPA
ncbi:MAG: acylneuraminate cytidylyltransferase family protein, partial [Rhodocyclaceae bacterium]|nr:acylneuraminate cytidylyltransferase family protein [Rhodocyclaceae bacterium]